MEQDKLIAEFMGIKSDNAKMRGHLYEFPVTAEYVTELEYHTSWDWLMSVVQKIESLGYVFTIQGGKAEYGEMISETQCFIAEDKRSSTYNAVVEFIKQYNIDKDGTR